MILINRTFTTVTPESAEIGDFAECGFLAENEPVTFRELVSMLRDCAHASCWPICESTHCWASMEPNIDYSDGSEETESIHYSDLNEPRKAKYWIAAMRLAFPR